MRDRAAEIISRVQISEVWQALGGRPPRHGRAPAFWRETRDRNVSLSDQKGAWHDHRDGIGGGILDLVQHVRGGSRADAYRWLAERFGLPQGREMTPTERREWGQRRRKAERAARPLARLALWWLQERVCELEDLKRAAVGENGINVELLTFSAAELHRLQRLSPDAVVGEYMRFKREHPEECSGLVRAGQIWENACRAVVRAVIAKARREATA